MRAACQAGRRSRRRSVIFLPRMIVERSMHPDWFSNAYLVADEPGGQA